MKLGTFILWPKSWMKSMQPKAGNGHTKLALEKYPWLCAAVCQQPTISRRTPDCFMDFHEIVLETRVY